MTEMLKAMLQYMISSPWFKKYSGIIGGFTAGLWVMAHYHKQIFETATIWGITDNQLAQWAIIVIGASGVVASIGLQMVKSKQDAADNKQEGGGK